MNSISLKVFLKFLGNIDLELGATFATSLTYHLPTYQETISEWNKIKLYSCIKLGGRRYEVEVELSMALSLR